MINLSHRTLHTCTTAITLVAITLVGFLLTSCNKNKPNPDRPTFDIPASAITAIDASQAISVKFIQTDGTPKVTVTTRKAYADHLNIRMDGTTLVAAFKPGSHIPEQGVEVVVKAPALNSVKATSAASINLNDEFAVDGDFRIETSSAGSVKAKKFKCQNLTANSSSASQILLPEVICANIEASASSASLIVLGGKCEQCRINEGSAAEVRCNLESAAINRSTFKEIIEERKPEKKPTPKDTVKTKNEGQHS